MQREHCQQKLQNADSYRSSQIFVEKKWTQTGVQKKFGRVFLVVAVLVQHGQLFGGQLQSGLQRIWIERVQCGRKDIRIVFEKKILVSLIKKN